MSEIVEDFTVHHYDDAPGFEALSADVEFEQLGKGRKGKELYYPMKGCIPIVRTTTSFKSMQEFTDAQNDFLEYINWYLVNNAMIEIYEPTYRKMKFHTDQSTDLSGSPIQLYSCYEEGYTSDDFRKLVIKNKETGKEREIVLEHNTMVTFDLDTNSKHVHKIILDRPAKKRWLGLTMRWSTTFVKTINDIVYMKSKNYLEKKKLLRIATDEERKQFYQMKGEENKKIDFKYPPLDYTLSKSHLATKQALSDESLQPLT